MAPRSDNRAASSPPERRPSRPRKRRPTTAERRSGPASRSTRRGLHDAYERIPLDRVANFVQLVEPPLSFSLTRVALTSPGAAEFRKLGTYLAGLARLRRREQPYLLRRLKLRVQVGEGERANRHAYVQKHLRGVHGCAPNPLIYLANVDARRLARRLEVDVYRVEPLLIGRSDARQRSTRQHSIANQ